ncbi:MAG TPA: hypothetical protein DCG69_05425 [Bacteroidales bacterium]|nr:hypothetical protein [Bacteroidales bacterium]
MINSRIILIFLFLTDSIAYAQKNQSELTPIDKVVYVCTYQLDYLRDSKDQESRRSEKMVLFIGKSVSKFQSLNAYIKDTINWNRKTDDMALMLAKIKGKSSRFAFNIYKNYPEGEISTTDRIYSDNFIYNEPLQLLDWEMTDDTTTYLGYHCQKATTYYAGRNYEAWFTSEIPISEGPYKFNGLPGLIVKIKDTRNHYSFELISFVKSNEQYSLFFGKGII